MFFHFSYLTPNTSPSHLESNESAASSPLQYDYTSCYLSSPDYEVEPPFSSSVGSSSPLPSTPDQPSCSYPSPWAQQRETTPFVPTRTPPVATPVYTEEAQHAQSRYALPSMMSLLLKNEPAEGLAAQASLPPYLRPQSPPQPLYNPTKLSTPTTASTQTTPAPTPGSRCLQQRRNPAPPTTAPSDKATTGRRTGPAQFSIRFAPVTTTASISSHKNAPKRRSANSFLIFSNDLRGSLRETLPDLTNKELSKRLGSMWSLLTEEQKMPYRIRANELQLACRKPRNVRR
eukprot:TRINITY_DN6458_c2_g3_i2.p1 TRINITY_DN6458_c2_g3~~TRINITY_DN6458_c2_g3_i2.p1  ORF type:complete len:288 (+),score=41.00 TRINITY_DN6458_c2_g3_i2:99-962(+)